MHSQARTGGLTGRGFSCGPDDCNELREPTLSSRQNVLHKSAHKTPTAIYGAEALIINVLRSAP